MFDSVFGAEMPLAVRFFLAFLIVLGLIGATAWAVRRFGAGRLGGSTRGRQPRLAVVDYASVDGRRRLVLVRRDNIEHLMMIGGPTDVVVEANIVRATAAPRDIAARPTAGLDALPRAIPLPETGSNGVGSWPLAPEPAPRAASRLEPLQDEMPRETPRPPAPLAEPPARPQRDTLAALADELSTRPTPPRRPISRPLAEEQQQEARANHILSRAGPSVPAAATPAAAETGADQSLADMAQRLEAALHKPGRLTRRCPSRRAGRAGARRTDAARATARAEAARYRTKAGPGKAALYDSLEQEMASLLGRPTKN